MTKLGVIPSNRSLDEADLPDCVNVGHTPDGITGPWTLNASVQASGSFPRRGRLLAFGACSGYATAVGQQTFSAAVPLRNGAQFPSNIGTLSALYQNEINQHNVGPTACFGCDVAAGDEGSTLALAFGIFTGISDASDYAAGAVIVIEPGL